MQRTSDASVNRRALDAKVAPLEKVGDTRIGTIAFLGYLVAAIELCVSTSPHALFDSHVTANIARVLDAIARVLALVPNPLVALSVAADRGGVTCFAGGQGRGRYCKGESQDSDEPLGKHFGRFLVDLRRIVVIVSR